MIHHRQGAGHTEADWTRVRIWLRSKLNRRSAKHFRARLELDVYFQADRCDVVHRKFQIEDFKFEEADLRVATKIATNSLASRIASSEFLIRLASFPGNLKFQIYNL
jgi:hypothetical protein